MFKHQSRKQKNTLALAIFFFLGGLTLLFYTDIEKTVVTWQMNHELDKYSERLAEQPLDLLEKLYQEMVEYNQDLYASGQSELKDPFSFAQPSFDLSQFGLQENIVGYLSLPQIGIKAPIYLGASNENLDHGAAQLTYTSMPVGGDNTNTVLAGHRAKWMFWNIHKLKPGDEITLTNFRETLTYRVTETIIIEPNESDKILIKEGKDLLTLISCNPQRDNYERIVVYSERVNLTNNQPPATNTATPNNSPAS